MLNSAPPGERGDEYTEPRQPEAGSGFQFLPAEDGPVLHAEL